jgi:hypothetical protein
MDTSTRSTQPIKYTLTKAYTPTCRDHFTVGTSPPHATTRPSHLQLSPSDISHPSTAPLQNFQLLTMPIVHCSTTNALLGLTSTLAQDSPSLQNFTLSSTSLTMLTPTYLVLRTLLNADSMMKKREV